MGYRPGFRISQNSLPAADQIKSLIQRGMDVPDDGLATRCLTHIGFRRLSSYWWLFQEESSTTARFRPGTAFTDVKTRYTFDQRLRSLLLEALSDVEVSVGNHWSRQLAQTSSRGEHAHLDQGIFHPAHYSANLQELGRNYNRARRPRSPDFPSADIWEIVPTMPFSSLSKWYSSIVDPATRQVISGNYGLDESTMRSALRYLTAVRNTCAHHERIWNMAIKPGLQTPRRLGGSREDAMAFNRNPREREKIYNGIVMVTHLSEVITPTGNWPARLLAMREAQEFQSVPYHAMGFPEGWREFAIWQRHLPR